MLELCIEWQLWRNRDVYNLEAGALEKDRVTEVMEGEETDMKSKDGHTEEVTTEVLCAGVQAHN